VTNLAESKTLIAETGIRLGCSVDRLKSAIDDSNELIDTVRTDALRELAKLQQQRRIGTIDTVDIVAFGSMARGEMSKTESDFDYLLVANGQMTNPDQIRTIREAADHAKSVFEQKPVGLHTGFGELVSALDLVNLIGLEADTNRNHTARILLLEESLSILNPSGHRALVEALLDRYLYDYLHGPDGQPAPKRGVPRFLLNDIIRYWRTVAVDYQSKRWVELRGERWGMRYLKLRSTRKLVFLGSLVSLFMPRLEDHEVDRVYLREQFELTPLARLCQLEPFMTNAAQRENLKDVLTLADYFCEMYSRKDFRDMANMVEYPSANSAPAEFKEVRERTSDLQDAIESLFRAPAPLEGPPPIRGDPAQPLTLSYLRDRYLLF
jgi:predicted nucleotidyltransferase